MDFFFWYADGVNDPSLVLLDGQYDPWLVTLSVALAIFAATLGLQAAHHARTVPDRWLRNVTLGAGSFALGCGVWAMHFIGMLAFQLCTEIHYDAGLTALSMVPGLGASWVGLRVLSRDRITWPKLLEAGVLGGAGIGAMHYMGMAAMRMSAELRYDPLWFGISLVMAVVLAVTAMWMRFQLPERFPHCSKVSLSLAGGTVMGLAIAGTHYAGMMAALFIGDPTVIGDATTLSTELSSSHQTLALAIALVVVIIGVMSAAAMGLARYRQLLSRTEESEARLRAITDTSKDGILVFDTQGTIHQANPGASRIFGRPLDELLGASATVVMVEPYRSLAQRSFSEFLQEVSHLMGEEIETYCQHPDGRREPVRMVFGRMDELAEPLYVAYFTDISERKRMERALRDSEAQFRSLIANIPGISYRCRLEPGWPMVYISDAAERITGWAPQMFVGANPMMRFADLLSKDDVKRVAQIVQRAIETEQQFVLEFQLRAKDGRMRWMWGNGSIVRASDQSVKWIDGVLLDITERHEMESELLQAKDRAEAAAAARSTFLANMSHEIRTPMNAIIGFTEVVLGGSLAAEQRRHLETVHKSARSLLHLLNDILDTSKLERGAVELESLVFSLPDLLQQLCLEQSIQAGRKNLVLRNICALDQDHVLGDPHRLRQILLNLLGNAIKFTERGEVELRAERRGDMVHFVVRDTGIGIAPERLGSIFEAFTQADASMSRRFGGTGLGTTIAKQLTDLMGGRIWAESTVGVGSTFHVELPLPASDAAAAPGLRSGISPLHLPPMRILVVDDVAENTELLCVVLGRQGHQLTVAHNGQEALDQFARSSFDVVLMDVQMPVMDGLSACRAIRRIEADEGRDPTPVIALSASVQQEDRNAALAAGMDGFASKPLDLAALMQEMSRVTGVQALPEAAVPHPAHTEVGTTTDAGWLDVSAGLARWGEAQAYHAALQRFAREQAAWLTTDAAQRPPAVPTEARAVAHRLKGTASNLALPALTQCSAALEQLDDATPPEVRSQAWQATCTALQHTIQAIDALLPAEATTPGELDGPPAVDASTVLAWQQQAEQLRQGFLRGECLEPHFGRFYQVVRPHVDHTALSALMRAVDEFDFDAAAAALATLQSALSALTAVETAGAAGADAVAATPQA